MFGEINMCFDLEMVQDTSSKYYSRKSIPTEEKDNATYTGPISHPRACLDLSTVEAISASSEPKSNDYKRQKVHSESKRNNSVYRRRKLHRNSVALFPSQKPTGDGNISNDFLPVIRAPFMSVEVCTPDLLDNENTPIYVQNCPKHFDNALSTQKNVPRSLEDVSKSDNINECFAGEQESAVASISNVRKSTLESCSSANDNSSSSISNMEHGSVFIKTEADEAAECSSSDIVTEEVFGKHLSEKELCEYIVRRELFGKRLKELCVSSRACAPVEIQAINGDALQSCKICGLSENPLKMLICDLCEEAFHLSCCNPRVKKTQVDEWYCQPCMKKKPKPLLEIIGKSSNIMSEMSQYRKKALRGESGPISFMLKDQEPYTSGVRIGNAFQAEVPDWSGPISNDPDTFGEPLEMDLKEHVSLNGWNANQSSTHSSIGSWLQCREDIGEGGQEIVCGKWRRAPLFEVQTDNWDCFCSVLWDPIHSDCAVPQELGTDEVLMHLKYIQLLRPRLAGKKRDPTPTKSDGCVIQEKL
ncbi:RING/FYVE/PHD zinc finger superfamily protein isoform X2 [Tasmannia lanceolata]|uniref:RING/FYVE/PHD zinc finger superfamily protein isoform X2 n=1 Tax=Tasmannia lanceolata TaxID=3420 RepID=UPI004063CBAE